MPSQKVWKSACDSALWINRVDDRNEVGILLKAALCWRDLNH